jgi:hypothetical protein
MARSPAHREATSSRVRAVEAGEAALAGRFAPRPRPWVTNHVSPTKRVDDMSPSGWTRGGAHLVLAARAYEHERSDDRQSEHNPKREPRG